ncbi:phosphatidate cytidylyltransferase [Brevibacterium atlanticum]|uniref:phosphatidate cytidylyltransferase n=1 Tax=Brevibacterium atlanticum TaxID=2697563 RepID=UPI001D197133|nr:phosphatidate cytidylyltransferase [Brevibacterium atlanticum]
MPAESPFPRRRDLRNSDKPYSPDDPDFNPTPEADAAEEEPPPKDYGRAGRNLPAAIGMGLLIGGVVLASLIFLPISFLFLILVAIVAAMWELANALSRSGSLVSRVPTMVSAACMVVATYIGGREALWVTFAASAGAIMLFTMVERRKNAVKDVSLSLFALTYVGLMACFVVYLLTQTDGNYLVIVFLASVVASDTGGYVFGVLWGKHPIAPRISPKKSWEGYLGSVVFSAAVATVLAVTLFDAPFWTGLVFGVVIPAFATLGDFSESMIKRDLELKDMGTLLPGHGGVMDRLDSILPTAPVALVLFSVLPGFL